MLCRSAAVTLLGAVLLAQSPNPDSRLTDPVTIKATTQLVIVDVTVTGSHGMPVHNLKASDFVVLEDTVSQNIKAFEEHTSVEKPVVPVKQPPCLPESSPTSLPSS